MLDGVNYIGWRGYDPGPGSKLSVACRIEIGKTPNDIYACTVEELTIDRRNYSEHRISCDVEGLCRTFDTSADYTTWKKTPLTPADRIAIGLAILNHELNTGSSYMRSNLMDYFVSIDGKDIMPPMVSAFGKTPVRLLAGSKFSEGKGMRLSIGGFQRGFDGSVKASFSYYCGDLCASAHEAMLVQSRGKWTVVHSEMLWIS